MMSANRRSQFKEELSSLTNSMIDTVMDAVLYITFNMLMTTGTRTMKQVDYGMYQANALLSRYNSQTIRRALDNLVSHKYIQRKETSNQKRVTITHDGLRRINEMIPTYKDNRPWDGYLYLISYDIPIKSNAKRNLFREYLQKIGCGKLQDSLWMTPYNPTGIVNTFIEDHHIPGTIMVSKLGKDGTIGDEDRKSLIARVYGYEKLNTRYEEFIGKYRRHTHPSKIQLSLDYYAIVKDDPQLPFLLEPDTFSEKEAHRIFQSFFS